MAKRSRVAVRPADTEVVQMSLEPLSTEQSADLIKLYSFRKFDKQEFINREQEENESNLPIDTDDL